MLEIRLGDGSTTYYNSLRGDFVSEVTPYPDKIYVKPYFPDIELYLALTESCNFRCPDCAVGSDRLPPALAQTMDTDTLELMLSGAFNSAKASGRNTIKIKYAGGEPLLPKAFSLISHAQALLSQYIIDKPEITVRQVLLTNGSLLTKDLVEQIKTWNMSVSVSLWGLDGQNNQLRGLNPNSTGTSKSIDGIQQLCEAGVPFNINHVVSPINASNLLSFVTTFWDINSPDFIGSDWHFPKKVFPLPVAFQFLRPQTPDQLATLLTDDNVTAMVTGLTQMFREATRLTRQGIKIPGLTRLDYLQPFNGVTVFTCGSGINYIAAGPRGISTCHENLFMLPQNLDQIHSNSDILQLANASSPSEPLLPCDADFPGLDPDTVLALGLHGGAGCPRSSRDPLMLRANDYVKEIYAKILPEFLIFEATRRKLQKSA